jgi:hypothetical protein
MTSYPPLAKEKSLDFDATLAAFLMVVIANSAPWLAGQLLHPRLAYPLDGMVRWPDGIRVLGDHKTWRGFGAAVFTCGISGLLLHLGALPGAGFGALAMVGDALSSAIKRRLRLASGSEVFGLDQLPEALLPLLMFAGKMHLNTIAIVAITLAFVTLDRMTSRLRHKA